MGVFPSLAGLIMALDTLNLYVACLSQTCPCTVPVWFTKSPLALQMGNPIG
jgi:hypothetical protein